MKIEVRIAKKLGAFGLDIRFTSSSGVTVLFGPSGSGKTLTLDSIAGFLKPDEGRIQLDDRILFDSGAKVFAPPRLRGCGYVVQDHALFPHMTLRQNLDFAAAALPALDRRRKANEMLDRFRIDGAADYLPRQMSGGQKQRGSIARALLARPSLLLLDEPSRGLDAELKAELYAVLRQVRDEFATPMFLVSHDLDECLELGEEMLVLHAGHLIESGAPQQIADHPRTQETARLLGLYNVFDAEILTLDPLRNTSRLRAAGQELNGVYLPGHFIGDRVAMCVRRAALRARPRGGKPEENEVQAALERSVLTTHGMRLEFEGGLFVDSVRGPAPAGDWLIHFPPQELQLLSS